VIKLSIILCIIIIFSTYLVADWVEIQQLLASDGNEEDLFGYSVSIDGNYAVVGARNDGSAYVFYKEEEIWIEQIKLVPSDGHYSDFFGYSVCIEENCIVVGAPNNCEIGTYTGAAYVFEFVDNEWEEIEKLLPNDGNDYDHFGRSVSLSGNYIVIGSCENDENGSDSGAAYVYYYDEIEWSEQEKIIASEGSDNAYFGISVSISNDFIVCGAYSDYVNNLCTGSAYIFKRFGENWIEETKLFDINANEWQSFGKSVSIDGDYLVIGASEDSENGVGAGAAFVYHRDENIWNQEAKLTAGDSSIWDFFGIDVCIKGDLILAGAFYLYNDELSPGSAYLFQKQEDNWIEITKLTSSAEEIYDYFGDSVSLSEDYILVGASYNVEFTDYPGAAFIFHNDDLGFSEDTINDDSISFRLENYPNPFNPSTTIAFSIPEESNIEIIVYNIKGQKVKKIVKSVFEKGYHSIVWKGDNESGRSVSAGVYFYKLKVNGKSKVVRKCLLLK